MVGFLLHRVYFSVYPAVGKKATAGFTKIPPQKSEEILKGKSPKRLFPEGAAVYNDMVM